MQVLQFVRTERGAEQQGLRIGVSHLFGTAQEVGTQISDRTKLRAEVTTPLRDQVRFVDNQTAELTGVGYFHQECPKGSRHRLR